jgi:hypothetical protein
VLPPLPASAISSWRSWTSESWRGLFNPDTSTVGVGPLSSALAAAGARASTAALTAPAASRMRLADMIVSPLFPRKSPDGACRRPNLARTVVRRRGPEKG